jgi:ArsR family transcriptional regulator, arsenate/arsenite/antimonite-responsive transcriptional repressor
MEKLKKITKVLKALSDDGRLRIICLLNKKKDLCVCEIKELIGLSQSTISSHLKKLENSGLISYSKDGKWINYNLDPNIDDDARRIVKDLTKILEGDSQIFKDYARLKTARRENICKK